MLDVWAENLPEFGPEALAAKYSGLAGEGLSDAQTAAWDDLKALPSVFTMRPTW